MNQNSILVMRPPTTPGPRPPKQPRSERTLERLVRAGLDLLERAGPEAVTVQAVAARARSSVGSFYARFAGKEDFLEHLAQRIRQEELARLRQSAAADPWEGLGLRGAVERAVDLIAETSRRGAKPRGGPGDPTGEARHAVREELLDELAAHLLASAGAVRHHEPQLAVRLALRAAQGVFATPFEVADGDTAEAADALLRREAVSLVMAYLVGAAPDAAGAQADFFDAWS
jgi:AcrR family transcriptional regulator